LGRRAQGEGRLKIRVLSVGRDRSGWFEPAVQGYAERVQRHAELDLLELPAAKGALPPADARRREAEALLGKLKPESWLWRSTSGARSSTRWSCPGWLRPHVMPVVSWSSASGGTRVWTIRSATVRGKCWHYRE